MWLHTGVELACSLLAFLVGATSLMRYYAKREAIFLYVGCAFVGTGFLDAFHGLITSEWLRGTLPPELFNLSPWSWLASRLFLSIVVLLSWVYYKRQSKLGFAGLFNDRHVFVVTLSLAFLFTLFILYVPLPEAYRNSGLSGRPVEFLPGALFMWALFGYLSKGKWRHDPFEHSLVFFLIINVLLQIVLISFSKELFDFRFDAAHALKFISYSFVLVGLYRNMLHSLSRPAIETKTDEDDFELFDESFQRFQKEFKSSNGIRSILIVGTSIVVLGTAIMIGTMTYQSYAKAIVRGELSYLGVETQHAGVLLERTLSHVSDGTLFLSNTPPVQGIIRATNGGGFDSTESSSLEQWKKRLSTIFIGMLESQSELLQVRFIGVEDEGRELIRVERIGGDVIAVSDEELQRKGRTKYFTEGIQQRRGEVYFSDVNLNKEHDKIVVPYQPTIRCVTPVYDDNQKVFGAIVMNLNLKVVFAEFGELSDHHTNPYVLNGDGEFLYHPDPMRTFAFEFGKSDTIRSEYPSVNMDLIQSKKDYVGEFEKARGGLRALGFANVPLDYSGETNRSITVVGSTSMEEVIAASAINSTGVLVTSLIVLGFALVFAYVFSIAIANPLKYVAWATQSYGATGKLPPLPVNGAGEVGTLAKSLKLLHAQIEERSEELRLMVGSRDEANEQLKAAIEVANQATQAKSLFLATMSHEIRTPMNGLIGILDLMEPNLNEESLSQLRIAQDSAEALLVLINDILDFSKIEAGKLNFEMVEFDLMEMLESVSELYAPSVYKKGLRFLLSPRISSSVVVVSDIHRIRQVITNLINNAIKFTSSGEIEITSQVLEQSNGDSKLIIGVRDTGVGIDEKGQEKLFEAFQQANASTTRKFGGTGLGLSICQRIVELMGGEIGVESALGAGSTFWFTLPLGPECKPSPVSSPLVGEQKRVLLIEGHQGVSNNICDWLERWNVRVDVVDNLNHLLSMVGTEDEAAGYDFVIVDSLRYQSHKSFWESSFAKEKSIKNSKLILLNEFDQDATQSLGKIFDVILSKPVQITKLYSILNDRNGVEKSRRELEKSRVDLGAARILIVDDVKTNLLIASGLLKQKYSVIADVANDGYEAIEAMKKVEYDIVFMDCMMPGIDGYETTERIRNGYTGNGNVDVPIIAITANALSGDSVACLESGMSDYITKPLRHNEIDRVLSKWVKLRHGEGGENMVSLAPKQ